MMKFIIGLMAVLLAITACTYTSDMNVGTNFSSDQVTKIVKGKTTGTQLVTIFGEPQIKTVINETDVKWIYSYTSGSASTHALTMETTSDFTTHMLDILVRDGVVLNFAETNSPININTNTQSN